MKVPRGVWALIAAAVTVLAASAFPIYSLATNGTTKPGAYIISESTHLSPSRATADGTIRSAPEMIGALASFYDTIITVLIALLVVVVGLSIWSLRYISRTATEEAARDAAYKAIEDSKSLNDRLESAVADQVAQALEGINKQVEALENALRRREAVDETVEETQVVEPPHQER